MKLVLLAVVVVLAGCGGGPCKERQGTYRVAFSTRSGNCGAMPEMVMTTSGSAGTAPGCTGSTTASEDLCEVTLANVACPGADGYTVTTNGKVDWSQDGASGSGVASVALTENSSGYGVCSGSYDVTYTRL